MAQNRGRIAAAGVHNLLTAGAPGSGNSMLAVCLPDILPSLESTEALELGMIQSVAGGLRSGGLDAPATQIGVGKGHSR